MLPEIRLVIAVPTAGTVRMGFAYSLAGMVARIGAKGIPTVPECAIDVRMDVIESSVIHTNREKLVKRAIDANMTHLLFLDDDMVFEPQIIDIMMGRRQEIVCVNYLIKTENPEFVAVGLNGKRIPTREQDTGIVPIAYSGFGVSLFDLEVFKRTPQPWFLPKFMPELDSYTTEDNPCYERLRDAGATVYLDHDASKLVSHVGSKAWVWPQWKPKADVTELKKETA